MITKYKTMLDSSINVDKLTISPAALGMYLVLLCLTFYLKFNDYWLD